MASHIAFREAFTYTLPPKMSLAASTALMCGGTTVFNIFDTFDARPTQRVGVIGLGRLGHLAVHFANKVGCKVVVFSSTEAKREEALRHGAREFVATPGVNTFEGKVRPVHHLVICASSQVPWDLYMLVLYKPGTVYPLTLSFDKLKLPYAPGLLGGVRVQASIVAPRAATAACLTLQRFTMSKRRSSDIILI